MRIVCAILGVVVSLMTSSVAQGLSDNCINICDSIYPHIYEVHSGPEVIYPDSTIGTEPWPATMELGYFYRLIFYSTSEYAYARVDRIVLVDPGFPRPIIMASYDINFPELLNMDPHDIGFIEWTSPQSARLLLLGDQCYEFSFDALPSGVGVKACE